VDQLVISHAGVRGRRGRDLGRQTVAATDGRGWGRDSATEPVARITVEADDPTGSERRLAEPVARLAG